MTIAASGISRKFASSARKTSLLFRSGARICPTVRLEPTASMLDTTKQRVAIGTALLKSSMVSDAYLARGRSGRRRDCPSRSHPCQIPPEVHQTVGSAKQSREDRRVRHQDVAGAGVLGRHPDEGVELGV